MSDPLEIARDLRKMLSGISTDHPPELRWLKSTINDALSSPRWRRYERDRLIRELAQHYPSTSDLADALRYYQLRVYRRDAEPPDKEPDRLIWRIFQCTVDVPMSEKWLNSIVSNRST